MKASVGDMLRIKNHRIGTPDRAAQVLEVHGPEGAPPWKVRWDDTGHEALFFPGADAEVEHLERHA